MAKTKTKGKTTYAIIQILKNQSPKRRNLNDSLIKTLQQSYNRLSVSIIKFQMADAMGEIRYPQ